ncbi:MAG: DUF2520 domain-containing protein [Bifidobacteriaceae bacterium]|jgi:predicted short-subunit dehydrogenase-like oxidoreductase (DUF2520 family)|nr:DUF2520 domain-containing protein [Bifidobacteriaceae bacterium]
MVDDALPAGVVGFGRVGAALAGALAAVDHPVAAVAARSQASRDRADIALPGVPVTTAVEVAKRAGLVFLTVPDSQIAPLAEDLAEHWRPGQLVVHAAGAMGLEVLEPVVRAGGIALALHPVMTFTGTSLDIARLQGAPFAVEAAPGLTPLAEALAIELGGRPFRLPAGARPAYHAALSHAANHLVTLLSQALDILEEAGISAPETLIGPLTQAALDGALSRRLGALTGPASRGDARTLRTHVEALEDYAARRGALVGPELALDAAGAGALDAVASYRQLAAATLRAAQRAGRIDSAQAAAGLESLAPQAPPAPPAPPGAQSRDN